ncbi:MAG: ATP-binding protein [Burkholderiales bacterium]
MTLYGKLVAILVTFGAIMVAMTIFVVRMSQEASEMEMNQRLHRTLAEQLAENIAPDEINHQTLRATRERLGDMNAQIHLLDAQGNVKASSLPPDAVNQRRIEVAPLKRCLYEPDALPILGDDPASPRDRTIFSVAQVEDGGGYLYVTLEDTDRRGFVEQLIKTYSVREGMWIATFGLGFALLAGLMMIRSFTRPLRTLSSAMDQFRRGDFSEHSPLPSSNDEIGRLSATFKQMAERIRAQVLDLKQVDDTRRELVANISHDLRTPLASLRGYLETLLMKEDSLSAEEKHNYLAIAADQSARLSSLIAKLTELAKLDQAIAHVAPEPFMLSELAQDIAQKFDLAAKKKNVVLEAKSPAETPPVCADVGLIERALENLVENALRHTEAGGRVTIKLIPLDESVRVEVADSGCGIAAEHLPHIFDRFYRVEKSRHEQSSGLGLAIVKRIIELHESEIKVESNPGAGTKFTFDLPVHCRPKP